jgi:hypothetical protein
MMQRSIGSAKLTHPHHEPNVSIQPSEAVGKTCSIYPKQVRTYHQLYPLLFRWMDVLEMRCQRTMNPMTDCFDCCSWSQTDGVR